MALIKKTSVTSQINEYFSMQIGSHAWKVGELIPSETVLTKQLGVSRASLRTVISKFSALGVLKAEQGKGCYLMTDDLSQQAPNFSTLTHRDYIDIHKVLSFRLLIEPTAAGMCAALPEPEHAELLKILNQSLTDMEASRSESDPFIRADLDFHKEIGFACGNELIGLALADVFAATVKAAQDTNLVFGFEHGLMHHKKIIAAIEHRDVKAAEAAMAFHLSDAIKKISDK